MSEPTHSPSNASSLRYTSADHPERAAASSGHVNPTRLCEDGSLREDEIADLFIKCIKLASKNKINEKNAWDLKLIDRLSDIAKVEANKNEVTNFQKASCALEMSVKIYSIRVDSLHSEAYKILSTFNRTELEDEQELEYNHVNNCQETYKEEHEEKKISPMETLASSFEAINLKKFEVGFSIEPQYCHKSVLLKKNGVKGLLLNNLGVYGDCRVFLDPLEVPCNPRHLFQNEVSDLIDLSFAKDSIEQMVANMRTKSEISPTLSEIIFLLDKDQIDYSFHNIEVDFNSPIDHNWSFDHEDNETTVTDEDISSNEPTFQDHQENDLDPSLLFSQHIGFNSKQNDWAGPDHWKYHNPKGISEIEEQTTGTRKSKKKKVAEADLEFSSSIDIEIRDIFAPPRNPKSLLLPVNRSPNCNSLPKDWHYEIKDLLKLFLLPNVQCLGQKLQSNSGDEESPLWDKETELNFNFNNGNTFHDFEDPNNGIDFQPCHINQDDIIRPKSSSKQVDMTLLKKSLWDKIQEVIREPEMESSVSFKRLFATFPMESVKKDLSPHLFFLCLLHLANDHDLVVKDCPSLDDLIINIPSV